MFEWTSFQNDELLSPELLEKELGKDKYSKEINEKRRMLRDMAKNILSGKQKEFSNKDVMVMLALLASVLDEVDCKVNNVFKSN